MNTTANWNYLSLSGNAAEFAERHFTAIARQTDRIFAILLPVQWIAAILAAYVIAPRTWAGSHSSTHPHVYFAIFGGGLISSVPTLLCLLRPGQLMTRYVVAVGQMLMSGLLIHLTGGRIETHFHIFGSLAFLSFYRDWRVLVPATLVTTADHLVRGWLYPWSIYGVLTNAEWRWLEHAGWVLFEDLFLVAACLRGSREIRQIAQRTAALYESEELYRAVVEQTHDGILLLDQEARILECNEAMRDLLGVATLDEVRRRQLHEFDVTPSESAGEFFQRVQRAARRVTAERQFRRADGSLAEVEVSFAPIQNHDKLRFCGVVKDITESKAAEAQLQRLALIAQKTSNAVIVTDAQRRIEWVNEGFTEITGYTFEEVRGQKPGSFLQGPGTDAETVAQIRSALAEGRPFIGEICNYGKNGREYWLAVSITPLEDGDGNLQGYIAIEMETTERREMEEALRRAHDDMELRVNARTAELQCANDVMVREVTERKRAEGQLKEAQQFLRSVIDTDPNLIYVKDREGCFTLANQALADFYGTHVERLIGLTEADFNEDTTEVIDRFNDDWQVLDTLQDKLIPEEKMTDWQGHVRWFQTVKRPLLSPNGIAEHVLTISTDLTDRRILESQLRHAQKLESIGQLAAGIAHEINTPTQYVGDNTRFVRESFDEIVTVLDRYQELQRAASNGGVTPQVLEQVRAACEAADIAYLTEEIPLALQQSLEGVARIARIVQSMKDFAHPGSSEKKAMDLNRAIESTLTVARNEWKYYAEVETHFDERLPLVPCFLGEFNQVILNIIINATHAIQEVVGDGGHGKGKITIATQNINDEWAEIRVTDSGHGIPPEIRGRIFDPFFTTKEVGKGTGQGLAISHTVIVEKHGGQLTFETKVGHGTTFIIRLPLHPDVVANRERSASA